MVNHTIIQRIGKLSCALAVLFYCGGIQAAESRLTAQVDRNSVPLGDFVSLIITVKSDSSTMVGEPTFRAPDFEVVNEYNSISVSSQYDSRAGGYTMLNQQQLTKVMRPLKKGTLVISGIQLRTGNGIVRAPDISIQVLPSGAQVPPGPSQRMGQQQGGSNPRSTRNGKANTFVRAEISKENAFKGEQIVVSYYLYHQEKVFNIQVDKFPVLNGFLREDLDIPIMNQRLESEQVVLKGNPYNRSLLARYAAYPLQDGKLNIDSMSLKFNYYSQANSQNEDDPFMGFFQQLTPRVGASQSDTLSVNVAALPLADRPFSFVGGIGEFNLTSAVDKYDVHANDAVTLTVKVEGHGNVSSIQAPQYKWPENIELYDSKGRTQMARDGSGAKIFEFLLIPRIPGKLNVPPMEFGFFDPARKQYYTKSTEALQLTVLDPAPGTTLTPVAKQTPAKRVSTETNEKVKTEDLRYLKAPKEFSEEASWLPSWRILYGICFGALGIFLVWLGIDFMRQVLGQPQGKPRKRSFVGKLGNAKVWEELRAICKQAAAGAPAKEVVRAYELITEEVLGALGQTFHLSARSMSRPELKRVIVDEKGLAESSWKRIVALLEYAELVRFASSSGSHSDTQARNDIKKWTDEAEGVLRILESFSTEKVSSTIAKG